MDKQDYDKFLQRDRFAKFIGLEVTEVKKGYAVARVTITDNHLNEFDVVQGGLTFTLADYAFAAAANFGGQKAVGINITISYFQPPQGKVLTAIAQELHAKNKLASYNVEVRDEYENLVAVFIGMVYRKKEPLKYD